jgi:hypothetical protein
MEPLRSLLRSRKFLVMLGTLAAYAASRIGLNVSPEDLALPIGAVGAWLLSHGIADAGAAKAAAERAAFEVAAAALEASVIRLERKLKGLEPEVAKLP